LKPAALSFVRVSLPLIEHRFARFGLAAQGKG
jgi:hypothetical protein